MKRYLGFVLLALLPIIGCNQPSPTPPGPGPITSNGGGNNGGGNNGVSPVNNDPTKDWYSYSSTDNTYTVKFPGKPDEKPQSSQAATGPINYVLVSYSTHGGNRAFLSSSTMYTVDPSNFNVEKGLDGARDGAAKSTNATVTSENKIDYKGASGREFYMSMQNGTKAKERIYIVNKGKGPILYQALVVDTDGKIDDTDIDLFLKSLEIKDP